MTKLGSVLVGRKYDIRIMGILNTSPESFYKKSIISKKRIASTVKQMEQDGADFVDVGGMSTAPYLSTLISEKTESKRVIDAVKIIQNSTNLPISIDTCRASVAQNALELGVDIINDISGLKYDKMMSHVVSKFQPSVILCAYSKKPVRGNHLIETQKLLRHSIQLAKHANISKQKIVLDPAIGFFRNTGKGHFFTKINSDWVARDLLILKNLKSIKMEFPLLVSVSNKSFIGKILKKENPADRLFGSLAAEVLSVINGADIIRTHNVKETKEAVFVAKKFAGKIKKGL